MKPIYHKPATYNGYKQIVVTDDTGTDAWSRNWRDAYPYRVTLRLERSKHDGQWRFYVTCYEWQGFGDKKREACLSVRSGLAAIKKEASRIMAKMAKLAPAAIWEALEPETVGI